MNTKTWTTGLTAIALLCAGNAFALSYCDANNPCKLATETCHGSVCVPQAKLCKTDTSCTAWQVCDFTCPGSAIATTDPAPKPGWADAGSGAAPMPAMDAGSAIMPPPDAGESEPPMDAGSVDATPYIPPNCPKDVGVCVVAPAKVAAMPGCLDFCTGLVTCNVSTGGSGSTGSGGGSSGGGVPVPVPGPGGSGDSAPGFAPPPDCDGCSSDKMIPQPTDAGETDSATTGNGDIATCVTLCSVLVLENIAHKELVAAEQCVAAYPNQCVDMQTQCQTKIQEWGAASMADDSWTLGYLPGALVGPGDPPIDMDGGSTEGADASTAGNADGFNVFGDAFAAVDAVLGGSDGGGPKGSDGTTGGTNSGADAGVTGDAASAPVSVATSPASPASGCTASGSSSSPWSLTGLAALCLAALALRRRTAR